MSPSSNDLLFARQPIFDGNNKLYGFELLYRNLHPHAATFEDGNKATSELLLNYCGSIVNDEDSPYVKVFINLTRKLLISDYFFPVEPSRLVIEIVETTTVDDKLVNKVRELKKLGYQFALDDYNFDPAFDPLLPYVDYIKIDLMYISEITLHDSIKEMEENHLKSLAHRPIFLAEKVETQEMYDTCRQIGFELFQGYFLERPQLIYGKKISNNSETALQIVGQLQNKDISVEDVSHSISRDVKLSYQILKIINSPLCRLPRKVNSLKEAVVFLGLEQIKKWAMAMVLAGNSDGAAELFRIILTRARACELYAGEKGLDEPESFFTVGLFSSIDAVMRADKRWLIEKLDLTDELTAAILEEKGPKGEVLHLVTALEHADWKGTSEMTTEDRIELFSAHEHAISWANKLCELI